MLVVIFVLAYPAGLFLQFCPCTWGIVLWGALVTSHGFFGWPVIFWNFMEFLLSWWMLVVCLRIECLQTIMSSFGPFKESSNSSPMRWESVSSANLARFLYLLTSDNGNFFLIDSKFGCIGLPAQTFWCHLERFE